LAQQAKKGSSLPDIAKQARVKEARLKHGHQKGEKG